MDLKTLGQNIYKARTATGLTQENVANDLDISVTSYAKIERGETNVPFMRLVQIAEYFHVDVVTLVNEKAELNIPSIEHEISEIKNDIHSIQSSISKLLLSVKV
jgi:transcriptional regulator with XRE-family HTH domain